MGRGLSLLQKWILVHALENRQNEPSREISSGADLYTKEILAGFFGFPIKKECKNESTNPQETFADQLFFMHVVGKKKDRSAIATISRSVSRLQEKGLIHLIQGTARGSGVTLTEKGMQIASDFKFVWPK
ncbi:MAG: hypothetical protein LUO93_03315 [Methanomicrobiales archaeon]|nr:hypothetical protein [Methanomicrobiales archaeon]